MANKRPSHLLIDADILLYRFGHANEQVFEWEEGVESPAVASFDVAFFDTQQFIKQLAAKCKIELGDVSLVLSGTRNFRYSVLPSYKFNRKNRPKPLLYTELLDALREDYLCLEQDKLEGDDLMGIISTANRGEYIIASIDKDLQQIPGWHYNWNHARKRKITKSEAKWFFGFQILTGDPSDGYTGIPGIGPNKAQVILADSVDDESMWECIVKAYLDNGLTEADALQQARVARILRNGDYDFKREEIKLWTPDCGF